jgi:hypothetical protein
VEQTHPYILFPELFRPIPKAHLAANSPNRYLFESRQRTKFTTRRVQQIVAGYAAEVGLPVRIHPHLLRHQMLNWPTTHGLPDAQIQLISGHASKKSLEVYQHLSLAQEGRVSEGRQGTGDLGHHAAPRRAVTVAGCRHPPSLDQPLATSKRLEWCLTVAVKPVPIAIGCALLFTEFAPSGHFS